MKVIAPKKNAEIRSLDLRAIFGGGTGEEYREDVGRPLVEGVFPLVVALVEENPVVVCFGLKGVGGRGCLGFKVILLLLLLLLLFGLLRGSGTNGDLDLFVVEVEFTMFPLKAEELVGSSERSANRTCL